MLFIISELIIHFKDDFSENVFVISEEEMVKKSINFFKNTYFWNIYLLGNLNKKA